MDANFQQAGKDSVKHLLNDLDSIEESYGEHFWRAMAGMLSGPQAVDVFKWEITLATEARVIWMSNNGLTCFSGMTERVWSLESRDEIKEKFFANSSDLSLGEVIRSDPWSRGGILDLPLLVTLLKIFQKSLEPNFWDKMRDLVIWE